MPPFKGFDTISTVARIILAQVFVTVVATLVVWGIQGVAAAVSAFAGGAVGFLTMKSGIAHQTIISSLEIDNTFLGAVAENYVAQSLITKNYPLYHSKQ